MKEQKIVFLDDAPELRMLFKFVFETKGSYQVFCAESVEEMMLNKDQVLDANAIFLDIELGKDRLNGIDAFKWLQSEKFAGRCFFLTGHGQGHPLVREALELGTAEVLTKPMAPKFLMDLVEKPTC